MRRWIVWINPRLTGSIPTTCRTWFAKQGSRLRWSAAAGTSYSVATPRSEICRSSCAGPIPRGGSRQVFVPSLGEPWLPRCSPRKEHSLRKPAGQSCRTCWRAATTLGPLSIGLCIVRTGLAAGSAWRPSRTCSRDGLPAAMYARLRSETDSYGLLPAIGILERTLFLGERLLRDTDATSMSPSIEIRLPLVDQVLVQTVEPCRAQQDSTPSGKRPYCVGRLRGLNAELFERRKAGFVLPYDRWLRSGLGKVIDGTMRDPEAIKPTGLDPQTVGRLWQAFSTERRGCIGRGFGQFTFSSDGAIGIESILER